MTVSTLEFSMIGSDTDEMTSVQAFVEQFAIRQRVPVRTHSLTWNKARERLRQVALYEERLDVSQIGSTWLRDFVTMRAVRPFMPEEVRQIGAPEDFVPAIWESVSLPHDTTVWGIPWILDTRILFYRRDLLAGAGIDERTAFNTPQALLETLAALQAHGVAIPWVIPTQTLWRTLHTVASWLWGSGSDFVSPDGRRFLFAEPPALESFSAFFGTARYLTQEARGLSDSESDACFMQGKAAVTISTPWLLSMDEARLVNVGIASPPGPAFVGGSHLLIWKHSHHPKQALQLVRYLAGPEIQNYRSFHVWQLPARLSALDVVDTPSREFSRYLRHILRNGRTFITPPLWAIVEERLAQTFAEIWTDVLALPDITDSALHAILEQHLDGLVRRLAIMFI
ncbi:MAG: extracellular solute-binding protein [Anaerolineae bacterium]|nr:extracellular solute-binding protein [Anaerolineae bacterium]